MATPSSSALDGWSGVEDGLNEVVGVPILQPCIV